MDNYGAQVKLVAEIARREYGAEPEFLWPERSPNYFILRNQRNKKWFAAVMVILGDKIGHNHNPKLEIIDLRFDKGQALDFAENNKYIYPGWHMNKQSWITLPLDGTLQDDQILSLLEHSYLLSDQK